MPLPAPRASLAHASTFFRIFVSALVAMSALLLLWWNETDAVAINRSLEDAPSQVVSLESPVAEPVNEGRLVHATGQVSARIAPQDTDLDLIFDGALVVKRKVEAYQWTETQNGASFKYVQAWSPETIDSNRFRVPRGHVNPASEVTSQTLVATDTRLGDFTLSPETLAGLDATTTVAPPATPRGWIREGNTLFLGLNPKRPRLGDIRISYRALPLTTPVSIIARQGQATLSPYALRNGTDILMIEAGRHEATAMLSGVDTLRQPAYWIVRVMAFLALAISLFCATQEAARLMKDRKPAVATTPMLAWQLAGIAAAGVCMSCMAIAWMFRMPFESATALMLCSVALATAIRFRSHWLKVMELPEIAPVPTTAA
jgi:hypothetical protein